MIGNGGIIGRLRFTRFDGELKLENEVAFRQGLWINANQFHRVRAN